MGILRRTFSIKRNAKYIAKKTTRKIVKNVTRKHRIKKHGEQGENKVKSALNPRVFGKVDHKEIDNLTIIDSNGKSHQIDHIEIRENGIFCIETKNLGGVVTGTATSNKWSHYVGGKRYEFYNPVKQNKSHCYYISQIIGPGYRVESLVVLAQNNASNVLADNVINLSDLKTYLRDFDNGTHLSHAEMDDLYNKLKDASSGLSKREHIKNIKQTQKEVNDNICPRCGGDLVLRRSIDGNSFYGCSNYPRCKFTKSK